MDAIAPKNIDINVDIVSCLGVLTGAWFAPGARAMSGSGNTQRVGVGVGAKAVEALWISTLGTVDPAIVEAASRLHRLLAQRPISSPQPEGILP